MTTMKRSSAQPPRLSDLLDRITRGGIQLPWAAVRWKHFRFADGWWVERPSGPLRLPAGVQQALWTLAMLNVKAAGLEQVNPDHIALPSLPGEPDRWIGDRWVRAVIEGATLTFERYLEVRRAYEQETASGSSDRAAWERARALLLGRPAPLRGQSGRRTDLRGIPVAYRAAFQHLAQGADVAPATAKHYRSSLRLLFDHTGGVVPDEEDVERVLAEVATMRSYATSVASAWAALIRAKEKLNG